ncbi:unnamed protein product [Symbiodinium natans]|uniref:Uncharacterized protein n=1 Tax=Symbiodinium natans TaxID=878477 RepID=A0A812IE81_9DINO|nr:unnamed protein product [Symbiodinium natans]
MSPAMTILLPLSAAAFADAGSLPPPGPLPCSACLWAAKALRAALLEKMPKRVKAKQRRSLAEEALAGAADACAARRFPKQVVLWEPPSSGRERTPPSYQDFDDVRGGKSNSLTSEHFQLLGTSQAAKGNLTELCAMLVRTFAEDMVDKAARHEGRMYGALTEHWLCFRKAQLCTMKEAPPGKDDDDEEEL